MGNPVRNETLTPSLFLKQTTPTLLNLCGCFRRQLASVSLSTSNPLGLKKGHLTTAADPHAIVIQKFAPSPFPVPTLPHYPNDLEQQTGPRKEMALDTVVPHAHSPPPSKKAAPQASETSKKAQIFRRKLFYQPPPLPLCLWSVPREEDRLPFLTKGHGRWTPLSLSRASSEHKRWWQRSTSANVQHSTCWTQPSMWDYSTPQNQANPNPLLFYLCSFAQPVFLELFAIQWKIGATPCWYARTSVYHWRTMPGATLVPTRTMHLLWSIFQQRKKSGPSCPTYPSHGIGIPVLQT